MDLKALQEQKADVTVEFAGQKLNVTYAPHKYSGVTHRQLMEFAKDADEVNLSKVLEALLLDWDLDDKGVHVEPTAKGMADHAVPFFLMSRVAGKIMEDMRDEKNAGRSTATSP